MQTDDFWDDAKVIDKQKSYSLPRWILIILRSFIIIICCLFNICTRKAICPFIPFPQVKRYVESIVNLLCMRVILIMLGYMNFQCQTFTYFRKESTKIYLKSGFVGAGNHKSILDFLYYSYLFNPVFVRIIVYKKEDTQEIYYAPLSFIEGLQAALDCRGFDPIIIHSQRQYKAVKYRKLALKTLVSECFEQMNGPIFILHPGLFPKNHIAINRHVAQDIYENEVKFQRSLVGFCIEPDERVPNQIYKNQYWLILDLLSRISWLKMKVEAIEYRKHKYRYDKTTYASFVDKFYKDFEYNIVQMEYQKYLSQLDLLFSPQENKKIE